MPNDGVLFGLWRACLYHPAEYELGCAAFYAQQGWDDPEKEWHRGMARNVTVLSAWLERNDTEVSFVRMSLARHQLLRSPNCD